MNASEARLFCESNESLGRDAIPPFSYGYFAWTLVWIAVALTANLLVLVISITQVFLLPVPDLKGKRGSWRGGIE